ncbi:MAG: DUF4231 domain-containing protein [Beijerinckiaceae bacterium]|nr:DUF4231 domain-containing protein [Beijerinckiaceae bacterium]
MDQLSPTLVRLDDQIAWYDKKSQTAQRRYKELQIIQIIAAAVIPAISAFPIIPEKLSVTAALGLLIVIVQGIQQMNQDQQNWITYRSTCEALNREKFLFHAGAGPYLGVENALALLADRIESLMIQEQVKWVSDREQARKEIKDTGHKPDANLELQEGGR